jgi:hypothetical protein
MNRCSSQLTSPTMMAPQNAGQNPFTRNGSFRAPAMTLGPGAAARMAG